MDGQLKIDTMFAFIATGPDGTEGLIAAQTAIGAMPLVGADIARVDSVRPLAQQVVDAAAANGQEITVRLVHFSTRTDLEVLAPAPPSK